MIVLNIFCPECTPYLLLMLAGAWVLGWLFWKLFKESGYLSNIKKLEHEVERTSKKNVDLQTEVSDARYEVTKNEEEMTKLRTKIGNLDLAALARNEELAKINEAHQQLQLAHDKLKS